MIAPPSTFCDVCFADATAGHSCTNAPPPLTGQWIDRKYRVDAVLGRGSMGTVVRAFHPQLERHFAIKVLHGAGRSDRAMLKGFQREAKVAGRLRSEFVVTVADYGVDEALGPYLVMEELEGETLASILSRGPLPVRRAVELVAQAALGVRAAHAAGLIHRDLKPANLFVSRRDDGADWLKVLDFGVARAEAVSGDASCSTSGNGTAGTVAYMAPEQARGERKLDQRVDVHALGVILYECLSGRRPHPGDDQNQILYHVLTKSAEALPDDVDVPEALRAVLATALEADRALRFGSVEDLRRALLATVEPASGEGRRAEAQRPPRSRSRRWAVLAGAALASALVWSASHRRLAGGPPASITARSLAVPARPSPAVPTAVPAMAEVAGLPARAPALEAASDATPVARRHAPALPGQRLARLRAPALAGDRRASPATTPEAQRHETDFDRENPYRKARP